MVTNIISPTKNIYSGTHLAIGRKSRTCMWTQWLRLGGKFISLEDRTRLSYMVVGLVYLIVIKKLS